MGKGIRTVSIREAKIQLSKLVNQASRGKPFIITKAGRPLVKVIAVDAIDAPGMRRLGFLVGEIEIPEDFNSMGSSEIGRIFESKG
jgi:prevent-host-death family protein